MWIGTLTQRLRGGITIKIDQEKCVGCYECVPYCPLGAIKKRKVEARLKAFINQDECVECAVCLRAEICNADAIYQPELEWPRSVRQAFSAVLVGYDAFERAGIYGYKRPPTRGGRGTDEMKTNDVTGRYKDGEVGIAAELGRPCQGFYFKDLEKVTMMMAKLGAEFEPENPLIALIDPETGQIKYREIMKERCMSAIVEMKVGQERVIEVIESLKAVAKEIDTVLSVNIINKCKDGAISILPILEEAGIHVRINGKTNMGLGRPLIQ